MKVPKQLIFMVTAVEKLKKEDAGQSSVQVESDGRPGGEQSEAGGNERLERSDERQTRAPQKGMMWTTVPRKLQGMHGEI